MASYAGIFIASVAMTALGSSMGYENIAFSRSTTEISANTLGIIMFSVCLTAAGCITKCIFESSSILTNISNGAIYTVKEGAKALPYILIPLAIAVAAIKAYEMLER